MLANRVREATSTTGTTQNITLGGPTLAHSTMEQHFSVNDRVYYVLEENDNYEIGFGTYLGGTGFQRTETLERYENDVYTPGDTGRITLMGNAEIYVALPTQVIDTFALASAVQTALDLKFDKVGGTINGNVTIVGSVDIQGDLNTQIGNEVEIGDTIITLNAELPASSPPTADSGFEVNRGNQTNANILFIEAIDIWRASHGLEVTGAIYNTTNANRAALGNTVAFAGSMRVIDATNPWIELWDDGSRVGRIGYDVTNGFLLGSHDGSGTVVNHLRVNNSGMVGIGDSVGNPTRHLHVNSGASGTQARFTSDIASGLNLFIYADASRAGIFSDAAAGGSGVNFLAAGEIEFRQNATRIAHFTTVGNFVLPNNKEIRWLASDGTERTALELDSSDNFNVGTSAGGDVIFRGAGYAETGRLTAAGALTIEGSIRSDAPSTTGIHQQQLQTQITDTDGHRAGFGITAVNGSAIGSIVGQQISNTGVGQVVGRMDVVVQNGASGSFVVAQFNADRSTQLNGDLTLGGDFIGRTIGNGNMVYGSSTTDSLGANILMRASTGADQNDMQFRSGLGVWGQWDNSAGQFDLSAPFRSITADPLILLRGTEASGVHSNEIRFQSNADVTLASINQSYFGGAIHLNVNAQASTAQLHLQTQGVTRVSISATEMNLNGIALTGASGITADSMADGTAAAPGLPFVNDTDTGIYRPAANVIGFATGGIARMTMSASDISSGLIMRLPIGTAALPAYSFNSDTDTGIYRVADNALGITSGGGLRITVDNTNTTFTNHVIGSSTFGQSNPSFAFSGDLDTGIYRIAANNMGFATGGVLRMDIGSDGTANFQGNDITNVESLTIAPAASTQTQFFITQDGSDSAGLQLDSASVRTFMQSNEGALIGLMGTQTAHDLAIRRNNVTKILVGDTTIDFQGNTLTNFTGVSGTELTQTHNAAGSGSDIDITGIPAGANEIKIIINGVTAATGIYSVQIGDSGGIESTGYSGAVGGFEDDGGASGNTSSFSTNFLLHADSSNDNRVAFITLNRFDGNTWIMDGKLINVSGTEQIAISAGEKTLSGELDRIRLSTSGGSFSGGNIRVAYR